MTHKHAKMLQLTYLPTYITYILTWPSMFFPMMGLHCVVAYDGIYGNPNFLMDDNHPTSVTSHMDYSYV